MMPISDKLFVPKFHGYSHEDGGKFLGEFESYLSFTGLGDLTMSDQRIIAAFHLHLAGPALIWFSALSSSVKSSWGRVLRLFKSTYVNSDPLKNASLLADAEIFQHLTLSAGVPIEDFHSQVMQKGHKLRKSELDMLTKFIDGLPPQLRFFVRTGRPNTLGEALQSAKMGEAYGYRDSQSSSFNCSAANLKQSNTAKSNESGLQNEMCELRNQVKELADVVKSLQVKGRSPVQNNSSTSHSSVRTCFKCGGKGHVRPKCLWNGTGTPLPHVQCQLCEQYGHQAKECSGNSTDPGVAGRGRPG